MLFSSVCFSFLPSGLVTNFLSFDFTQFKVDKLGTGSDLPYRIGVHPGGEGVICSFPNNCRYVQSLLLLSVTDELSLFLIVRTNHGQVCIRNSISSNLTVSFVVELSFSCLFLWFINCIMIVWARRSFSLYSIYFDSYFNLPLLLENICKYAARWYENFCRNVLLCALRIYFVS